MATSTANVNLSDDKTTDIYASIAVLWIASMTAVAGRFISRRLSHQKLWWDDWLIVISCVSMVVCYKRCRLKLSRAIALVNCDCCGELHRRISWSWQAYRVRYYRASAKYSILSGSKS